MLVEDFANLRRQGLVAQHAGREIHGHVERAMVAVDLRGRLDRLVEHEQGQLLDPVVLFGGGDEFARADRALFRMGPARQRLGAPQLIGLEVKLRLIGDPHLAIVDRIVELAEQRQPPLGVLQSLRVMIFPAQALDRRLVGGDQRAVQAIGKRTAAADLDAKADGDVERLAFDLGRAAEQGSKRLDMMADRRPGGDRPGENSLVALIDGRHFRSDLQPSDNLLDQAAFVGLRQRRYDLRHS